LPVNADYELVLTKTADRTQVRIGETINFTLQVQNTGTAPVTGGVAVVDLLPPGLDTSAAAVTVSRADAQPPVITQVTQDGVTQEGVTVVYVGQAVGETVTITIAATVTAAPPADQSGNTAVVVTEEESTQDNLDDNIADVPFAVLPAASTSPSASATAVPTASASATTAPTTQPTASTSTTPGQLPDTGAGTPGAWMLVLLAGALLASGVAAQAVLRRRAR
jgi:uncharacterized repeat protein (TIGR01451 family)